MRSLHQARSKQSLIRACLSEPLIMGTGHERLWVAPTAQCPSNSRMDGRFGGSKTRSLDRTVCDASHPATETSIRL